MRFFSGDEKGSVFFLLISAELSKLLCRVMILLERGETHPSHTVGKIRRECMREFRSLCAAGLTIFWLIKVRAFQLCPLLIILRTRALTKIVSTIFHALISPVNARFIDPRLAIRKTPLSTRNAQLRKKQKEEGASVILLKAAPRKFPFKTATTKSNAYTVVLEKRNPTRRSQVHTPRQ